MTYAFGRTGGGMSSGAGYLGGYGNVQRSAYATPIELGAKPWALDFNVEAGMPSYPTGQRLDPVALKLQWQTNDWDPGLRFWTLAFDVHLSEWLQDVDLSAPSVLAAREFAVQHDRWSASRQASAWIDPDDLKWKTEASTVNRELEDLVDLMQRERAAYLDEAWLQSDNIPLYFMHLLGMDAPSKPWTMELIRCGLSIGNLVYMHYKDHFKRVRPSLLCPGLVPPWGPPRHPAFPSGHSFLGHFIALLLLSIPDVAKRYGVFPQEEEPATMGVGRAPALTDFVDCDYSDDMRSPLLWLAWRLARNRERIGVHYRSDSSASRHLAAHVWAALLDPEQLARVLLDKAHTTFKDDDEAMAARKAKAAEVGIDVPTLKQVLRRATTEWPQIPEPDPQAA